MAASEPPKAGTMAPAAISRFPAASLRLVRRKRPALTRAKPTTMIVPTAPATMANTRGPGTVIPAISMVKANSSDPSGTPSAGKVPDIGAASVTMAPSTANTTTPSLKRLPVFSPITRATEPAASIGMLAMAPRK